MAAEDPTLSKMSNEDEPLFDPGLKKKKNKKTIDFDLEEPKAEANGATSQADAGPDEAEGADEDMFGGLKKKSKKKKAIPMDLVSVEEIVLCPIRC